MYICIYVYIYIIYICIGQTLLKIKHKVKWMINLSKHKTPYSHTHSFVSTIKHLGKIRRLGCIQFLLFLLYVNSLKKIF